MEKTKIVLIVNNIGWMIFDRIFMAIANVVVLFAVANYYGAEEYGLFQYATNIVLILEVVILLVDGRVVKKMYSLFDKGNVIFNASVFRIFFSGLVFVIGLVISSYINLGGRFNEILVILLADSFVKNFKFGMETRFEYDLLSKKVVIASNVGLFIGTIFQIVAIKHDKTIVMIALIQLVASVISSVILSICFAQKYLCELKPSIDWTLIKGIFAESIPLTLAAGAATIYSKCDSLMIGKMLSFKDVGIYSIAAKFISLIQLLIIPVQTTIYIRMIEWKNSRNRYEEYYLLISSMFTWIAIIIIVLSNLALPLILKLFKQEYLPAMGVFRILSVGTVFMYNAILRSGHFTLERCGGILLKVQLATVIINIVLNYFFINHWEMNGAAIATTVSLFFSLFLSNLFFKDARFVFRMQIRAFNPRYFMKAYKKIKTKRNV